MQRGTDHRGLTLIEVLIAAGILGGGLLALLSVFPIGYVDVSLSGGQSKSTAYAQQLMEQLKNRPFNPGPLNQTDVPEPGYTRTGVIRQEPGTHAPNRLTRVTVIWT